MDTNGGQRHEGGTQISEAAERDVSGVVKSESQTRIVRSEGTLPAEESRGSTWRIQRSAPALIGEEVARARGWAVCVMLLPTVSLVFLPWMPGKPVIKALYVVSALSYVMSAVVVLWMIRSENSYTPRLFRVWGYFSAVLAMPILYCLGTFSPTPLIVTLGLSFFGQGLDRRHAVMIPTTAVALYFLLAMAILFGTLPDYGMFSSSEAARPIVLFFTVMVPMVLMVGVWFSRVSHRALRHAVERATAAQRLAGDREAQMLEAQRHLENLLRAEAGRGGRYTGAKAGPYELGVIIGRGAMGEVYEARGDGRGHDVAVKLVRADVEYEEAMYQRFLREGELVEGLNVPNVVKVILLGQMADGAPFIAMERLYGEDLGTLLRRERAMDWSDAIHMVSEVGKGVDAAHAAGVIHRDLKPQNIFLHQVDSKMEGTWKVLDFGVSKLVDSTGTLTQGAVIGTPAYMAPEQAGSDDVDHRCDIYALTAVVYRVLTGRTPFSGVAPTRLLFQLVYFMPPDPMELNDKLPRDVARVLAIGLAKDPEKRFSSAAALAGALRKAVKGRLSDSLRMAADELLTINPWGERVQDEGQSGVS